MIHGNGEKFEDGLTYTDIANRKGISATRAGQLTRLAIRKLRRNHIFHWIKDGYKATIDKRDAEVKALADELIAAGEDELAKALYESPISSKNFKLSESQPLVRAGISNLGQLVLLARNVNWYESIQGIGYTAATHIEKELYCVGLIDEAHKYPLSYRI